MDRFWWQQRRPSAFISQLLGALRDGKCLVLCLPKHVPDGLYEVVRACSESIGLDSGDWRRLEGDDLSGDPADRLVDRFLPDWPADALRGPGALAAAEDFGGRILFLESLAAEYWPRWRDFLVRYADAARSVPLFRRTLVVVCLEADLATAPPAPDVGLGVLGYDGMGERLDMQCYAAHRLEHWSVQPLQRDLLIATVAQLAMWDPGTCDQLTIRLMAGMTDLIGMLRDVARQRGWDDPAFTPTWHNGAVARFGPEPRLHSALLALRDSPELVRRIWTAQVEVLLPVVEEFRHGLLGHLLDTRQLELPYETPFGLITDPYDLEIGPLWQQLKGRPAFRHSRLFQLVSLAREIRNALSHLKPLDWETLDFELLGHWRSLISPSAPRQATSTMRR